MSRHMHIHTRNMTNYEYNSSPRSVCTYFEQNWQLLRKQWNMVEKLSSSNFLNANSRLESLDQRKVGLMHELLGLGVRGMHTRYVFLC